jgi:hypothetical protein
MINHANTLKTPVILGDRELFFPKLAIVLDSHTWLLSTVSTAIPNVDSEQYTYQ